MSQQLRYICGLPQFDAPGQDENVGLVEYCEVKTQIANCMNRWRVTEYKLGFEEVTK